MKIRQQLIGSTRIPLITLKGDEPGETVFVVAGIHGDEQVGPMVAWHLVRFAKIARGTLYIIPVANTEGLALGMRGVPASMGQDHVCVREGQDMNRSFPGSARAKPGTASAIARQIYGVVYDTNPTVVIDLHNWIDPSTIFAIVDRPLNDRAQFVASQSIAFARKFGVSVCNDVTLKRYVAAGYDNSFTGALVNRAYIPAFTVELGDVPRAQSVFAGIAGVLNILKHCHMLDDAAWTPRVVETRSSDVARIEEIGARSVGAVKYKTKPGKLVFPGACLARLATHNGRMIEFKAKRLAIVLALGPTQCTGEDDALVTLAVLERR